MRARNAVGLAVATPPEGRVEVFDGLLEREGYALFLVVGRDHNADEDLGGLDGAGVGDVEFAELGLAVLGEATLSEPCVVPAWELAGGGRPVGAGGEVGLFGWEGGPGFRSDVVEGIVDLYYWQWLVLFSASSSMY